VIADADDHKYLIHDRDSIFARHLDDSIRALGLAVLRSPFSNPKANAICERACADLAGGPGTPGPLAFGDVGGRVGCCWASAPMTKAGRMESLRSTGRTHDGSLPVTQAASKLTETGASLSSSHGLPNART
jgi:hypothetical protein